MASLAVAQPGNTGTGEAASAAARRGGVPGLTMKLAPASSAACNEASSITVPAPVTAPGTSRLMAAMAASAPGVRSVTSMAGRPPATSARACATPSAASRTVSTGITGASRITASVASWWA